MVLVHGGGGGAGGSGQYCAAKPWSSGGCVFRCFFRLRGVVLVLALVLVLLLVVVVVGVAVLVVVVGGACRWW